MGRLDSYKSPSKLKRNINRLLNHLKKSIKPVLTLSEAKPVRLAKSLTVNTSYPDPCPVCHHYQCEPEIQHKTDYLTNLESTLHNAVDKMFAKFESNLEETLLKSINDLVLISKPPT